jgi:hypothetical protein
MSTDCDYLIDPSELWKDIEFVDKLFEDVFPPKNTLKRNATKKTQSEQHAGKRKKAMKGISLAGAKTVYFDDIPDLSCLSAVQCPLVKRAENIENTAKIAEKEKQLMECKYTIPLASHRPVRVVFRARVQTPHSNRLQILANRRATENYSNALFAWNKQRLRELEASIVSQNNTAFVEKHLAH